MLFVCIITDTWSGFNYRFLKDVTEYRQHLSDFASIYWISRIIFMEKRTPVSNPILVPGFQCQVSFGQQHQLRVSGLLIAMHGNMSSIKSWSNISLGSETLMDLTFLTGTCGIKSSRQASQLDSLLITFWGLCLRVTFWLIEVLDACCLLHM